MYMYLINGKDFLGSLFVLSMLLTWFVLRENGGFLHLHFCDSFPFAYNQLNHILSRGYHLQGPICFTKKSEQAIRELAANQQKPFILSITRYSYKNHRGVPILGGWGGGGSSVFLYIDLV